MFSSEGKILGCSGVSKNLMYLMHQFFDSFTIKIHISKEAM